MDRESPELIEQEMQQTRASLTEKVAALENQVIGTIQSATDAVHSTVESVKAAVQDVSSTVKDTVSESVHTVKEQVSNTLDVTRHTRENPWAMVGGAAAVGFVAGYFLCGPRGEHSRAANRAIGGSFDGLAEASRRAPMPAYQSQPATPRRPSWLDEIFDRVGEEARKIGEMALASATASLRQTVQQQVPKLIEEKIPKLIEDGIPKLIDRVQAATGPSTAASPTEEGPSYSHPGSFQGSPYPRPTSGDRMTPGGPSM